MTTQRILNYRKENEQILYYDYKRTLAFIKEIGQSLDLFNMQHNRLVMHAGSLTLSRKNWAAATCHSGVKQDGVTPCSDYET